ncbi:MAG: aminopeptidase P N-terminal domain-containing protein [Gammaproteobacteria bacterium]|nr:aminopeptidase P N-terminal domain-containing protein [Gammaproteobacteria bacterium]
MMLSQQHFERRRKKIFSKMKRNSIGLLFSAPLYERTPGIHFNYRQDSDFYYLTGFKEPNAIAVFIKKEKATQYILFSVPDNEKTAKWEGHRIGQKNAIKEYGADLSYPISHFKEKILELFKGISILYYPYHHHFNFHLKAFSLLHKSGRMPAHILDFKTILHPLRMIKNTYEIELMQKAANITGNAIIKAMQSCKPSLYEYQLESEVARIFKRSGAKEEAFPTIVASGPNACTLHYDENKSLLKDGDLVLIDTGCEYEYYASDVSRTFPINGKFSQEQHELYQLVLDVQTAVINSVKPEMTIETLQKIALAKLTEGLQKLNIAGNPEDYYYHGVSHFIGLDVHDVGNKTIPFKPGMVITIEPGIYIAKDEKKVEAKWRGIGIRIEDEVLITKTGCYILTNKIPKTIKAIEKMIRAC